jgi:DNA-binding transcriptional MerR regulator
MWIEWVNHASFILESGEMRLICDPWLEGTICDNGWRLLSPTRTLYEDFSTITHIWFSHEHPDHFNPPNLRKIPEAYRRSVTILFHHTRDKRVINFCKSLGFKIQELPELQKVEIAEGVTLLSGMQDLIDSWMSIQAEGKTLLNMNDCAFDRSSDLEAIRKTNGKVDLLLSQFSFANWIGNPDELESHQRQVQRKRAEMARQIRLFTPAQFIPFASFVYFCHAENFHMNSRMHRIRDAYEYAANELQVPTIVLYPKDRWEVGAPHDSSDALRSYDLDYERALAASPVTSDPVDITRLRAAATAMFTKCAANNNRAILYAFTPAVVRLSDLGVDVELSFRRRWSQVSRKQPDIITSSESLLNCLITDWGGETLMMNGRFQAPPGGKPDRFFRIFKVLRHNSIGNPVNFRFLGNKIIEKAKVVLAV